MLGDKVHLELDIDNKLGVEENLDAAEDSDCIAFRQTDVSGRWVEGTGGSRDTPRLSVFCLDPYSQSKALASLLNVFPAASVRNFQRT